MTSSQKAKGDAFERAIRDHLVSLGVAAERTRAGYARDAGDLHVGRDGTRPRAILQAKNFARLRFPEWLAELPAQIREAGALHGALVVKRTGVAAPGRQYVVMELDDWALLVKRAGLADGEPPAHPDLLANLQASLEAHRRPDQN